MDWDGFLAGRGRVKCVSDLFFVFWFCSVREIVFCLRYIRLILMFQGLEMVNFGNWSVYICIIVALHRNTG